MPWFHNLPSQTRLKFYSDLDQLTNEQSPILVGSEESYSIPHLMSQFPDMKQEVRSMTLENRGIAVSAVRNVQQSVQQIDEWLCAAGDDTIAFVNHFTMLQLSPFGVVGSEYGIDIRLLNTSTSSDNSYAAKLCLRESSSDGSQSRLLYPGSGGYTHVVSLLQPKHTGINESMPPGTQPHLHPFFKHLEHIEFTLSQFSAEDRIQGKSHSPHLSRTRIFRLLSALHNTSGDSKKRESQEHNLFAEHLRKLSAGEYEARVLQMGEGAAKPPDQMRKFDGEESPRLEQTYKRHPEWERDVWTRPSKSEEQMEKAKTPMDAFRRKRSPEHRRAPVLETTLEHSISPKTRISKPQQKVCADARLSFEHPMSPEHEEVPATKKPSEHEVSPKTNSSTEKKKSTEHDKAREHRTSLGREISPRTKTPSKHKKKLSHSSTTSPHKSTHTRTSNASTATRAPSVWSWSTLTKEEVEAFYAQGPVDKVTKKSPEEKASEKHGMRACLKSRYKKFRMRLRDKT